MAEIRYLLLPYETFLNQEVLKGVTLYRPKYCGEIGYRYESVAVAPDRKVQEGFVLIRIKPPADPDRMGLYEERLAQLLAKPDVEEIELTDGPLKAGQMARVRGITKAMQMAQPATGVALVEAIKVSAQALRSIEAEQRGAPRG